MNIIGLILILVILIFTVTLWIFIAKICAVLKTLKSIQSGVAVSVRGVGDLVGGELKNIKLTGIGVIKNLMKGKLK